MQFVLPRALRARLLCSPAEHRRSRFDLRASNIRPSACSLGCMGMVCVGYVNGNTCDRFTIDQSV